MHPARIEEVVAKVKKQLDNEIIETGKRTAIDISVDVIHGLDELDGFHAVTYTGTSSEETQRLQKLCIHDWIDRNMHHIDTDGMYKLLYFRTYIRPRCREDIRFFQAQLLANPACGRSSALFLVLFMYACHSI